MKMSNYKRWLFFVPVVGILPTYSFGSPHLNTFRTRLAQVLHTGFTSALNRGKFNDEQTPSYKANIPLCTSSQKFSNPLFVDVSKTLKNIGLSSEFSNNVSSNPADRISIDSINSNLVNHSISTNEHTHEKLSKAAEKEKIREAIKTAFQYNQEGNVHEAWKELSKLGDVYALRCSEIFGSAPSFFKYVVGAHWQNITNRDTFKEKFHQYAVTYQKNYIDYLSAKNEDEFNLPNTHEIEHLYSKTLKQVGLPQSLAVDLLHNNVPNSSISKKIQSAGASVLDLAGIPLGGFSLEKKWHDYLEFSKHSPERISSKQIDAGISTRAAEIELFKTALNTVYVILYSAFSSEILTFDKSYHHDLPHTQAFHPEAQETKNHELSHSKAKDGSDDSQL